MKFVFRIMLYLPRKAVWKWNMRPSAVAARRGSVDQYWSATECQSAEEWERYFLLNKTPPCRTPPLSALVIVYQQKGLWKMGALNTVIA